MKAHRSFVLGSLTAVEFGLTASFVAYVIRDPTNPFAWFGAGFIGCFAIMMLIDLARPATKKEGKMADLVLRKQFIMKCICAFIQNYPPPKDVRDVSVRAMSSKMSHGRYENMAAYIDAQLSLHEMSTPAKDRPQ